MNRFWWLWLILLAWIPGINAQDTRTYTLREVTLEEYASMVMSVFSRLDSLALNGPHEPREFWWSYAHDLNTLFEAELAYRFQRFL